MKKWAQSGFFKGPIPPELGQLDRLRDLRLNDNQLTGCVPGELAEWAGEMEVCGTAVEYLAGAGLPLSSGLDLNYPNPFNSGTASPTASPRPARCGWRSTTSSASR